MSILPPQRRKAVVNSDTPNGAELAGVVVVFLLIGWGLDSWLETRPVFMISLVLFSMVMQFLKMYFVYSHKMSQLEKERTETAKGSS